MLVTRFCRSLRLCKHAGVTTTLSPTLVPLMFFGTKTPGVKKKDDKTTSKSSKSVSRNIYRAEKRKVAKEASTSAKTSGEPNSTVTSANNTSSATASRTAKPSTTVSIYVDSELESEVDYTGSAKLAKETFFYPSRYVPPKEFHYELPNGRVPEFAFVGRSNVGKSSLINAILGDNKIVRISKTPGCTRSINYYVLESAEDAPLLYFVDLPGYGYAAVSNKEKQSWDTMLKSYLLRRQLDVLRRVYVLVDARRGINKKDTEMIEMLTEHSIPCQVLLTKADVVSQLELNEALNGVMTEIMKRGRHSCLPIVHVVSSKTQYGLSPLILSMAEIYGTPWGDTGGYADSRSFKKFE